MIVLLAAYHSFDRSSLLGNSGKDEKTDAMLDGYTTIAFFGVDNRSNGNFDSGNSDTIMLLQHQ